MATNSESWERLHTVIDLSGMTINAFARHLGMIRSEGLYQIKNGKNGISRNLADMIVAKFPQISKPWLLTGCGSMYSDDDYSSSIQIPYYNCDLRCIRDVDLLGTPDSHLFIPSIKTADLAICYYGDDMTEVVPGGAVLILKKVNIDSLLFGSEYVVVSDRFVTLRRVRSTDSSDKVRLEPTNKEQYDDMIMPVSDIRDLYAVVGKVIIQY